jgi:hypothetical protein
MRRLLRASFATLLAAAFAGAPLAAGECVTVCEMAATVGGQPHAHKGHHHTNAPGAGQVIQQMPGTCGHDHHAIVGVPTTRDSSKAWQRLDISGIVVPPRPPAQSEAGTADVFSVDFSPGRSRQSRFLPLRI